MSTTVHEPTGETPVRISEASVLAVLASGERPTPPGRVASSLTHGWRALLKIKHVPEQLFDVTMFPVMMLLLFSFLFGGALGGSVRDYVQTFVPGILVSSVLMITMYTGVGLNNDMAKGVSDRFRSLPSWRPGAIVGALLGDAVRYAISSVVIITLGVVLGFRPGGGPVGVLQRGETVEGVAGAPHDPGEVHREGGEDGHPQQEPACLEAGEGEHRRPGVARAGRRRGGGGRGGPVGRGRGHAVTSASAPSRVSR